MRTITSLAAPLLLFAAGARAEEPRDFCPDRPGLGFTLSDQMRALTKETAEFGTR